jgi:hypothetical protein
MLRRKIHIVLQCMALARACQFHLKYKDTFPPEPVKAKTSGLLQSIVASSWLSRLTQDKGVVSTLQQAVRP